MKDKLIESIKKVYPDIYIKDYQLNEIGQNNDVLIVNNSLVFRFPKYKSGIIQLKREAEILEYISKTISVSIPNPIYASFHESEPGKVFTGYKKIEGEPLWRKSLLEIKDDEKIRNLATQLVAFLAVIHSIPEEKARQELNLEIRRPREEIYDLYEKIQQKLFPFMTNVAREKVSESFKVFLEGEALLNVKVTLIHGDFGASNILWNPKSREISGIIDFGGSGLGDPAYDFAGILASYGEEFFNMCIGQYPGGKEIADRVKFYKSTFALQEALHGVENDDSQAFENGMKDYR
ncbi:MULTISPECIES: aminoglycoside phosphotransferase family protein [unclassified Mesobacillus]|jgi:aminoglycoside 2''-phosphotransferase|uniref:phosphotransferase family protein n=1 Tax=unclassified Mesobacillus TaxID=2675270 RepID=UPI00203ABFD7|nr:MULTISPECIES: aminoglycoside phosphotransferase family protein [unclassified Mesobacillus]MCM3122821.1 aminoglycoside phosphotransferase family protein [Mesobacillus sp. MER 33]MCM3233696.1 aminoglycoside phosphotransferase family protein [Mesobacillus sp. MER 48]